MDLNDAVERIVQRLPSIRGAARQHQAVISRASATNIPAHTLWTSVPYGYLSAVEELFDVLSVKVMPQHRHMEEYTRYPYSNPDPYTRGQPPPTLATSQGQDPRAHQPRPPPSNSARSPPPPPPPLELRLGRGLGQMEGRGGEEGTREHRSHSVPHETHSAHTAPPIGLGGFGASMGLGQDGDGADGDVAAAGNTSVDGRAAYNSVDAAIEPPVTGWMRQGGWRAMQASLNTKPNATDYREVWDIHERDLRATGGHVFDVQASRRHLHTTSGGMRGHGQAGQQGDYFDPQLRGLGTAI